MLTYRKKAVIRDSGKLTLTGLPFKKGERIEVVVQSRMDRKKLAQEFKNLCKRTQALPQAKTITEEDIFREIAAVRARK